MTVAVNVTLPSPLISVAELQPLLGCVCLLDARFDLAQPAAGESAYRQAHLPGALYAHLERDLSAMPPAPALCGGRHPLPTPQALARTVAAFGITPATPVVVYDASGGMYAARAWWLLRWLGHQSVAVLDGGLSAWVAACGALEAGECRPTGGTNSRREGSAGERVECRPCLRRSQRFLQPRGVQATVASHLKGKALPRRNGPSSQ